MIDRAMRSLILLTATMALSRTGVLAGEPLPPRALARIGDHRFYHGPSVGCAALSPDGKRIASAASHGDVDWTTDWVGEEFEEYNRVIVLWDALSGERLRELRVPHEPIFCLCFSPDGKQLAADYSSSDKSCAVAVFAVETGKLIRRLEHFHNGIDHLQFSPDSKQLRVSEAYGPVSAWDVTAGRRLKQWNLPPKESIGRDQFKQRASNGFLSPDGKIIAWEMGYRDELRRPSVWMATGLRVHQAATDQLLYRKTTKPEPFGGRLVYSTDSKRLATYRQGRLLVWDALRDCPIRVFSEPRP